MYRLAPQCTVSRSTDAMPIMPSCCTAANPIDVARQARHNLRFAQRGGIQVSKLS